jgi:uncharacterized peroxidase-related enzyme
MFIETINENEATGALAREYEAAHRRAGKVFNIVRAQSRRPRVLRQSMALYLAVMYGESDLTRAERELVAVAVSHTVGCHY